MIINEKSNKSDIIDSAIELVDTQSEQIIQLKQQQQVLLIATILLFLWGAIF